MDQANTAEFDFSAALDAEAREDFESAMAVYDNAIANAMTQSVQGEALFHRGSLLFRLGQYRHAAGDLEKSLKLSPEESPYRWEALLNLGMSRALNGDPQGAHEELVKAVALEPGQGLIWLNLAGIKTRLGDKKGAVMCAEIAVKAFGQAGDAEGVETAESLLSQLTPSN